MGKINITDYFHPANPSIPSTYEVAFSEFETLCKLITYVNSLYDEYVNAVNRVNEIANSKEDSNNITVNRKLSPSGDFTGTINGLPIAYSDIGLATDFNSAKDGYTTLTERLAYFDSQIYAKPLLVLSSNASAYTWKKGQTIASVLLNLAITKKAKNIVRIDYKRNGSVIHSNNTPNNTDDSYTDSTVITQDTNFQVLVNDGVSDTISNILNFYFVYPMYQGKVANGVSVPTGDQVVALNEVVKTKQNITQSFTLADEKVVFAYPSTYGNLTSIYDQNGFNITSSFTKTTANVTMLDNTVQVYNVYTMNNSATVTNFNITFNF